jgi:phage regulator Rha-like protein
MSFTFLPFFGEWFMSGQLQVFLESNLTMSSVEVAALTEKQHKHVIVDIEALQTFYVSIYSAEKSAQLIKLSTYKDASGKSNKCYQLSKDAAFDLVTGYSLPHRHAVNQRWLELESQQLKPFNLPTTYAEALRLLADETDAKELAQATVIAQQKTIKYKDDLIFASNEASIKAGEILIREFVKSNDIIDLGEKQFYAWMREQRIVSDKNEPYQRFIKAGYFTYKPTEKMHGGEFRYTLRVTPRGKVWLAAKYMAYLDGVDVAELEAMAVPRNGLVLMGSMEA